MPKGEADGAGLLSRQGPYLNELHAQGKTVNDAYIIEVLYSLLKNFEGEETGHGSRELVVFLGQCACSHCCRGDHWMGARRFQVIKHLPYSPDLAPADFFLFPDVKRELASLQLSPFEVESIHG
jgi:hypothetical protein